MTRPHGPPLGSVAAPHALSDWERRTALAAPDYDLTEQEPDEDEIAEGRLRALDYDAWADL